MKGFWNDADGISIVDVLAITLGLGTLLAYYRYGSVDTNFADIVVAALLASAGQKIGVSYTRKSNRVIAKGSDDPSGSSGDYI